MTKKTAHSAPHRTRSGSGTATCTAPSQSRQPYTFVVIGLLILSALGAWFESRTFQAKSRAHRALLHAESQQTDEAKALVESALAANPWQPSALNMRCVELKHDENWNALEATVLRLVLVSPNQAAAWRLAAESALRRGTPDEASMRLKTALRINPFPPTGPTNFWRLMAILSAESNDFKWGIGAAFRAVEFAGDDPLLRDAEWRETMSVGSAILQKNGLNKTAAHLENIRAAGRKKDVR